MSSQLNAAQAKTIEAELLALLVSLREDISYELQEKQDERIHESMKEAHDRGDEATADLQSRINMVNMSRHFNEIHECQDALYRLKVGTYGLCTCCGENIELNHLKANPVSRRCLSFQSKQAHSAHAVHYASL